MAYTARRAPGSLAPFLLLLACAGGADDDVTSLSGFSVSQPQVTDPGGSTGSAQPTTTGTPTTEAGTTGRETVPMRDTTTGGGPEPATTTGVGETTTGVGDDSSTGGGGEESSTGPVVLCGNGMIDAPEECDGANLDAMDCKSLGFTGGALVCTPQCIFDKAMCTSPSCGDGTVDPGEECDCGNQGAQCTAVQLGNAACTTLPSPGGGNYSAGALACNSPNSCSFNKTACVYCGDGVKNAAEVCDGGDLGGQTCQSQGFAAGNLSCSACAFNTGGCTKCGNGVVDGGEACDGGNFNGQTCASVDGSKFAGGNLSCSGGCDSISTGGCNSGNCCVPGGAGACQVNGVKSCVCNLDPYCCNNAWDSICVGEAKNNCGALCP